MAQEKRLRTKKELQQLFTNLKRRGITDEMMAILIDVLWRDKQTMRTSGFYRPGLFPIKVIIDFSLGDNCVSIPLLSNLFNN